MMAIARVENPVDRDDGCRTVRVKVPARHQFVTRRSIPRKAVACLPRVAVGGVSTRQGGEQPIGKCGSSRYDPRSMIRGARFSSASCKKGLPARTDMATIERTPPMRARSLAVRAATLLILSAAASLFGLAGRLSPSSTGMGTHAALGLPPCTFPMLTGYPCPTCGITTSFAYFARGRLLAAFHAQPAGFAIATALAVVLFGACWTLVTGRSAISEWNRFPTATRGWKSWWRPLATPPRVTALILGVILFGWLYKIAVGLLAGTLPIKG